MLYHTRIEASKLSCVDSNGMETGPLHCVELIEVLGVDGVAGMLVVAVVTEINWAAMHWIFTHVFKVWDTDDVVIGDDVYVCLALLVLVDGGVGVMLGVSVLGGAGVLVLVDGGVGVMVGGVGVMVGGVGVAVGGVGVAVGGVGEMVGKMVTVGAVVLVKASVIVRASDIVVVLVKLLVKLPSAQLVFGKC